MIRAWRIVKSRHAHTAFTGEGTAKYGGRWNSKGVPVVYTSSSKALAALELMVHLIPPVSISFVIIPVDFNEDLNETLTVKDLPLGWNAAPPGLLSQNLGNEWASTNKKPVMAVPSIITGEPNYLLNPLHPQFNQIHTGKPEPFSFNPRLNTRSER